MTLYGNIRRSRSKRKNSSYGSTEFQGSLGRHDDVYTSTLCLHKLIKRSFIVRSNIEEKYLPQHELWWLDETFQ
jgi:hypothetical protein